jgi:hypothetical protein
VSGTKTEIYIAKTARRLSGLTALAGGTKTGICTATTVRRLRMLTAIVSGSKTESTPDDMSNYKKIGRKGIGGSWWKHLRKLWKRDAHKKGRRDGKKEERER